LWADDSTIRVLRTADYPFILVEKEVRNGRLNTVATDTAAGSKIVAVHIKKLGYKNVLIIADKSTIGADAELIDELQDALKAICDTNDPVVIELDSKISDNDLDFSQFEKFLRPPFRAEIIIPLHSRLVYPVMNLLQKMKLRVPQDIAIISMEEGTGFDLLYSPVTCLRKPLAGIAMKSANMIWTEIKNGGKVKKTRQVNLPPELVVRNSCGTL
jgi:DNA-binding LacI/PurR family transcriptional regulator